MKTRKAGTLLLAWTALLAGSWLSNAKATPGNEIDRIDFGNVSSEAFHNFEPGTAPAGMPAQGTGAYGFTYREPLGNDDGSATAPAALIFTMGCDPNRQNYLSVKLWGNDTPAQMTFYGNSLVYTESPGGGGQQNAGGPVIYPNRFYYYTFPIPLSWTQGQTSVQVTLLFGGLALGAPAQPVYSAFTHTDPCFVPDSGDMVGSAPTRTGQATLTTLTSGSAIAILQNNRSSLYASGTGYIATVMARQVPLSGTAAGAPPEVVGLDMFTNYSTWVADNPGATADQWRQQIAQTEAGPGYTAFPDEMLGVLCTSYLAQPFVGTSGTVSGLDHYHNATYLASMVAAMDGATREQDSDGGFIQQGGSAEADSAWTGLTSTPRTTGEYAGTTAREPTVHGGGDLQGSDTYALGWTISQLLDDPSMPASTGTASPTNFLDYLGQTIDPDLGITGSNTFTPSGPMLRAYAYERMLFHAIDFYTEGTGGVESQNTFQMLALYSSYVALEKLQAIYPNSSYIPGPSTYNGAGLTPANGGNFFGQALPTDGARMDLGLEADTLRGIGANDNSPYTACPYTNYGTTAKGLGEAHGAISCGYDGGGYGQMLSWLMPRVAQIGAWDPTLSGTDMTNFSVRANAALNAFGHFLSPLDNATITSGTVSSDTFSFAEEPFITYRDPKNMNAYAGEFNFNIQYPASDPDGVVNNPYALRAAYLNTQYGLTPIPEDMNGSGYSPTTGGALNYIRDLVPYENTIRALIGVNPSSLTPLPGEPGQANFAWADEQAGAVAFMNNGERFYMNANWRNYETNGSTFVGVVPSQIGLIHDTTSSIERGAQAVLPYNSAAEQSDLNLSGTSMFGSYVVRFGNYLVALNNSGASKNISLPAGYGEAEELISGSTYNLGSTVAVSSSQSAIFWLAASGTMAGGSTAPEVASPAAASTTSVTGTSVSLSVLGTAENGDSGSSLVYTWSLTTPPDQVSYSANGTNGAKNTTVTFASAGTYNFLVVITDTTNGLTTSSNVTVTVNQTLSGVSISPGTAGVLGGQSQQFTGTGYDQFGNLMRTAPAFTWSLTSGVGSVNVVGLYTAPATAGSAAVTVSAGSFSASATVTPPIGGFPATAAIGSPSLSGSATYSGTTYAVSCGGSNIYNSSDQFRYVYQPITGNGTITAEVVSMTDPNVNAKAGVMFRDSLAANGAFAMTLVSPTTTEGVEFNYRSSDGGSAGQSAQTTGVTAPYWVQLTRSGNSFTAFTSPDGVSWTALGTAESISMPNTIYVGLAVCSDKTNALCSATFANVSITQSTHNIFPYDTDIGTSAPGSYTESGTVVTMTDQSTDIWSQSDGLHFGYTGIIGNGSITARVVSLTDTSPTCKAGVMMRNSLAGGSVEVNNSMQYSEGVNFQGRTSTGAGSTAFGVISSVNPPYWVRLTRTGNTFTAQAAPDVSGTPGTWTQVGPAETINSSQGTMLFGLDLSSVNTSELCTGVFDNISVTGTMDTAPTITTAASASGISGNSASLSVSGTSAEGASGLTYTWSLAGDPPGPVSYSANGTNGAQNTTVTFTTGGTYYFQVTVTDEAGLTVSSSIVPVSIGTIPPTNLTAAPGASQVVLGWTPSVSATSYNVERSLVSGSNYTTLAAGVSGTSYIDSIVTGGTTYYYGVSGNSSLGAGANSVELQLITSGTTLSGFGSYAGSITLGGSGDMLFNDSTGTYTSAVTRAAGLAIYGGEAFTTGGSSNEPANFLLIGSGSGNTDDSFGPLALDSGPFFGKITPNTASNATVTFGGLSRNPGTQLNFGHSTNFGLGISGTSPIGTGSNNVSVVFTTTPTSLMVGGGGADGTSTVDILPFVFVNNQLSTYDSTYGLRGLNASTEMATLTSGMTAGQNAEITSSGTTTLTGTTSVNALWGNAGTISGMGTLDVTSGAIVCNVSYTIGNSVLAFGVAEGEINVANTRTLTINSAITGSGGLTICLEDYNGTSASLVLGGSNTYTGVTTIEGNNASMAVKLTNGSALQDTTLNYNNYGASLQFGSGTSQVTSATFGGLEGAQSLALTNSGSNGGGLILTVGGDGDSTTFSGVLSGSGGIIKAGAGTFTLTGTCTYTGTTSIASGELAVTGSLASPVSVATSGTLGGSGVIGGAASVASGGVLTPSGTFTFNGGLTLNGGSTLAVALNGTPGQIAVNGAYSGPSTGLVTVNVASIGALGTYNLITGASGISAGSFQLGTAPAGYTYALSASNGTLSLAVSVPPAPTGVTATAGTGEVALSWNPSIGATSYDLQRTRTSGSGYALIASVVSGTTYTDSAVTNETTYYYVVSGSNAGGEGPNSSEVSAKPYIPIAPSELYPPAMAMVTMSGTSDWQFTIQTVAGRTYQLQWTNSLNPTNWQDEGAVVTGTGGPLMLEDPVNPAIPDRMYRILIQP